MEHSNDESINDSSHRLMEHSIVTQVTEWSINGMSEHLSIDHFDHSNNIAANDALDDVVNRMIGQSIKH